jgi:signal peptidase II
LLFAVAGLVVGLDQATKEWALSVLDGDKVVNLVGDWLTLRLVFNSGAALSMGSNFTWVFTILAICVTAGVIVYARRVTGYAFAATLGLLLAGAAGNLVDRLARSPGPGRGHVVDFIAYGNLFVGNVADIAIVVAMLLMVVAVLRGWGPVRPPVADGADVAEDEGDDAAAADDAASVVGDKAPDAAGDPPVDEPGEPDEPVDVTEPDDIGQVAESTGTVATEPEPEPA